MLGPTFDYTQRLLDFALAERRTARGRTPPAEAPKPAARGRRLPRVVDLLDHEGLIERERAGRRPGPAPT